MSVDPGFSTAAQPTEAAPVSYRATDFIGFLVLLMFVAGVLLIWRRLQRRASRVPRAAKPRRLDLQTSEDEFEQKTA